jgi:type III pantothenate kinase
MIICLDSGNTRIKWGVHDGEAWIAQGALLHADVVSLGGQLAPWPRVERVMLANVAGPEALGRIARQLSPWLDVLVEAKSSSHACGITNLYNNPERLGVDRWCALIGARALVPGAVVVVMAGTATTIDTLDSEGRFLGGAILPGIGLMQGALAQGTAELPFANGRYASYPRCTDDAIVSGAIEAQAGAIERAWQRIAGHDGSCLLSGGWAESIFPHLVIPCSLTHNLPLEGLRQIARQMR